MRVRLGCFESQERGKHGRRLPPEDARRRPGAYVRAAKKIKGELTSDPGPLAKLLDPLRLSAPPKRELSSPIFRGKVEQFRSFSDLRALGKLALRTLDLTSKARYPKL
jgi:hypothetical protein